MNTRNIAATVLAITGAAFVAWAVCAWFGLAVAAAFVGLVFLFTAMAIAGNEMGGEDS